MLAVPKGKGEARTSISAQTKEMSSELRFNAAGGCKGEEEKFPVFYISYTNRPFPKESFRDKGQDLRGKRNRGTRRQYFA